MIVIEINKDCDETIALSNAREVYVNKNVTVAKLEATDAEGCVGTGTLGGSNASGGSIRIGAYANATLYSGTLTGNNVSGDGGAVSVTGGNCSFTMYGGAITSNTATGNGGGISSYDSWNAGTVNINGGVISNNRATNGGGIYAASRTHFHLNGGEIINNTATGDGGGVYCSGLYSNANRRCEFNGSTISGNSAQRGCGATNDNPLGHDLPNDWSKDENKHWHECERCHSKEDEGDHEYGDDNTAFIWIALLLICASTATVTVIYGRRKKQR